MTGDLPREELMALAERTLRDWPPGTTVRFKFTCSLCGERCTLAEPNVLYERGECWRCGTHTPIERGGFMIVSTLPAVG